MKAFKDLGQERRSAETWERRAKEARAAESAMRNRIEGLEHAAFVWKGRNDARITLIHTLRKNFDADKRAVQLIEWWMASGIEIPPPLMESVVRSRDTEAEREALMGVWRFLGKEHTSIETDRKRLLTARKSNDEIDAEDLARELSDDEPAFPDAE
jgi:hypothetical protein